MALARKLIPCLKSAILHDVRRLRNSHCLTSDTCPWRSQCALTSHYVPTQARNTHHGLGYLTSHTPESLVQHIANDRFLAHIRQSCPPSLSLRLSPGIAGLVIVSVFGLAGGSFSAGGITFDIKTAKGKSYFFIISVGVAGLVIILFDYFYFLDK